MRDKVKVYSTPAGFEDEEDFRIAEQRSLHIGYFLVFHYPGPIRLCTGRTRNHFWLDEVDSKPTGYTCRHCGVFVDQSLCK